MKGALFYGPNKPLKIEEVDIPKIKDDELLIKVAACGVCHSDLEYIEVGVPTFKKPPLILGHEPSGTVEEVGRSVNNFKKGDRVILPAVFGCGECKLCRTGRENICSNVTMLGNSIDGAYAEYIKVPAKAAVHLPDEIPLKEGCVIADAISTPFHAVRNRAMVRPGDIVVIFGCGGVGINVIQISVASGATVIAVDILDKKLEWAREFGANITINSKDKDIAREIRRITSGGADIAIEVIGKPETIRQAADSLRIGGRLCIVGYSPEEIKLSSARIMMREIEIVGSCGSRPADYPKVIEMVKTGKIKVKPLVTHKFSLNDVNEAFEVMKKGESLRSIIIP
jgi:6-hydroxycyclohex-1-ene-1-carbonyl-CoA dehydrogenase